MPSVWLDDDATLQTDRLLVLDPALNAAIFQGFETYCNIPAGQVVAPFQQLQIRQLKDEPVEIARIVQRCK